MADTRKKTTLILKQPASVFYGRLLRRKAPSAGGRKDRRHPFYERSLPLVNKSTRGGDPERAREYPAAAAAGCVTRGDAALNLPSSSIS